MTKLDNTCPQCRGTGEVDMTAEIDAGVLPQGVYECSVCDGSGVASKPAAEAYHERRAAIGDFMNEIAAR